MAIERIFAILAASLLLASGAALSAQSKAGDPINEKNWLEHPRIKEIRALFSDTEQAISAKRLVSLMADEYQQAWGLDAEHIRKLSQQRGSEDSAVSLDHYYDPAGTLRFAFVRANAVNGTKIEYRVYFDERGKRLWHNCRKTAGPGYTFPEICPDDWLVFDPYTPVNGD
jgi:hypothetical protein